MKKVIITMVLLCVINSNAMDGLEGSLKTLKSQLEDLEKNLSDLTEKPKPPKDYPPKDYPNINIEDLTKDFLALDKTLDSFGEFVTQLWKTISKQEEGFEDEANKNYDDMIEPMEQIKTYAKGIIIQHGWFLKNDAQQLKESALAAKRALNKTNQIFGETGLTVLSSVKDNLELMSIGEEVDWGTEFNTAVMQPGVELNTNLQKIKLNKEAFFADSEIKQILEEAGVSGE